MDEIIISLPKLSSTERFASSGEERSGLCVVSRGGEQMGRLSISKVLP